MNTAFRSTRIAVALAVAGLLAASAVLAQPRGPMLQTLDTDKDGSVSQAEHDAHRAEMVAGLDADADGTISFEEMQALHERKREERARAHFLRMDGNGDGQVSIAEFNERHERMFERMDKDGDGAVSGEELRQGHRRMHGRMRGGHAAHDQD